MCILQSIVNSFQMNIQQSCESARGCSIFPFCNERACSMLIATQCPQICNWTNNNKQQTHLRLNTPDLTTCNPLKRNMLPHAWCAQLLQYQLCLSTHSHLVINFGPQISIVLDAVLLNAPRVQYIMLNLGWAFIRINLDPIYTQNWAKNRGWAPFQEYVLHKIACLYLHACC